MMSLSTRKYEAGLPYLPTLDASRLIAAQKALEAGDLSRLPELIASLAKSGEAQVIRKLSAIYSASETEIKAAIKDPAVMAELEDRSAEQPFSTSFSEAIAFFFGAALLLGVPPSSLGINAPVSADAAPETAPKAKNKSGARSKG